MFPRFHGGIRFITRRVSAVEKFDAAGLVGSTSSTSLCHRMITQAGLVGVYCVDESPAENDSFDFSWWGDSSLEKSVDCQINYFLAFHFPDIVPCRVSACT